MSIGLPRNSGWIIGVGYVSCLYHRLHCLSSDPRGTVSPNCSSVVGTYFFRPRCTIFQTLLGNTALSVFLSYFILAVLMRKCSGKHSCTSYTFPIGYSHAEWWCLNLSLVKKLPTQLGRKLRLSETLD